MIVQILVILCLLIGQSANAGTPESVKTPIIHSLRKNVKYTYDANSGGVIATSRGKSKLIWSCKIDEFKQFDVLKRHGKFDYIFTLKYDENETGFQFFVLDTGSLDATEKKLGLADFIASKGNLLIFLNNNEDEAGSGEGIAIIDIRDLSKQVVFPELIIDKATFKLTGSKMSFSGTEAKTGIVKKGEYLLKNF